MDIFDCVCQVSEQVQRLEGGRNKGNIILYSNFSWYLNKSLFWSFQQNPAGTLPVLSRLSLVHYYLL